MKRDVSLDAIDVANLTGLVSQAMAYLLPKHKALLETEPTLMKCFMGGVMCGYMACMDLVKAPEDSEDSEDADRLADLEDLKC